MNNNIFIKNKIIKIMFVLIIMIIKINGKIINA